MLPESPPDPAGVALDARRRIRKGTDGWVGGRTDGWMDGCMYLSIYLSIYVTVVVCVYIYIYIYIHMYMYSGHDKVRLNVMAIGHEPTSRRVFSINVIVFVYISGDDKVRLS